MASPPFNVWYLGTYEHEQKKRRSSLHILPLPACLQFEHGGALHPLCIREVRLSRACGMGTPFELVRRLLDDIVTWASTHYPQVCERTTAYGTLDCGSQAPFHPLLSHPLCHTPYSLPPRWYALSNPPKIYPHFTAGVRRISPPQSITHQVISYLDPQMLSPGVWLYTIACGTLRVGSYIHEV